jgi:hypothetical protein
LGRRARSADGLGKCDDAILDERLIATCALPSRYKNTDCRAHGPAAAVDKLIKSH